MGSGVSGVICWGSTGGGLNCCMVIPEGMMPTCRTVCLTVAPDVPVTVTWYLPSCRLPDAVTKTLVEAMPVAVGMMLLAPRVRVRPAVVEVVDSVTADEKPLKLLMMIETLVFPP